ncbi:MAG: hypothetical protein HQ572_05165 [Candidatus Omnitrophica bacterium]|nr:hypothetical protein [Candidatus Omnitrophota bacterium]
MIINLSQKNRAFLLIEVLITVVIVSASIVFINHAFSTSLRAISISNDYLKAVLLLEDKSFDFEAYPVVEEGEFSGEEEFMQNNFVWEQVVEQLEEEDLGDEDDYEEDEILLKRLRYSLKWSRQNAERNIDILTYTEIEEIEE